MQNWPLIRDVIDLHFTALTPEMSIQQATDLMVKEKRTGAPVVEERRLVGILSEKDCLKNFLVNAYHKSVGATVADYMTRNVVTVSSTNDIVTAAQVFLDHEFRRLPVVDDDELVGVVTRLDIQRKIQKLNGVHDLNDKNTTANWKSLSSDIITSQT